jgi:hypothetical protein
VDLQLRLTNHGPGDDLMNAGDMQLRSGAEAYAAVEGLRTCYVLVASEAAGDDCRLHFVVADGAERMALRVEQGDAAIEIPLAWGAGEGDTLRPLPPAVGTPDARPAEARPLKVEAPAGSWPLDLLTYEILSAETRPYDAQRTAVVLRLAMTNRTGADSPLGGNNMRLLVDGVPRAPEGD